MPGLARRMSASSSLPKMFTGVTAALEGDLLVGVTEPRGKGKERERERRKRVRKRERTIINTSLILDIYTTGYLPNA